MNKMIDNLIYKRLKSDKATLAGIIKTGLACPSGVPRLRDLVAEAYKALSARYKDSSELEINNDQKITPAHKARLAYLRIQIHLNQIEHDRLKGTKKVVPHFWSVIEDDLLRRTGKSQIYKFAFANLILCKDKALWGDKNRPVQAKDVTAEEAALPTDEEITAKIAEINSGPPQDDSGVDGAEV